MARQQIFAEIVSTETDYNTYLQQLFDIYLNQFGTFFDKKEKEFITNELQAIVSVNANFLVQLKKLQQEENEKKPATSTLGEIFFRFVR